MRREARKPNKSKGQRGDRQRSTRRKRGRQSEDTERQRQTPTQVRPGRQRRAAQGSAGQPFSGLPRWSILVDTHSALKMSAAGWCWMENSTSFVRYSTWITLSHACTNSIKTQTTTKTR